MLVRNRSVWNIQEMDEMFEQAVSIIDNGDDDCVSQLNSLLEVNPALLTYVDVGTTTLLYIAAQNGNYDICLLLLNKGADVHFRSHWGTTPLAACETNDNRLLKLFLSFGADINAVDRENRTPLYSHCCWNGSLKYIEQLLKHGADANIRRTTSNQSCVFLSLLNNNDSLFWLLVKNGALLENDEYLIRNLNSGLNQMPKLVWRLRVRIALCSCKLLKNKKSHLALLSIDQIRELCTFMLVHNV